MGPRLLLAAACAGLVASCATAAAGTPLTPPRATPAGAGPPFVLGEALIKSDAPLAPGELERGAALEGLSVQSVEPTVGRFYLVRFARRTGELLAPADEAFTRAAVEVLRRAPGVLACEPNSLARPTAR